MEPWFSQCGCTAALARFTLFFKYHDCSRFVHGTVVKIPLPLSGAPQRTTHKLHTLKTSGLQGSKGTEIRTPTYLSP